MAGPIAMQVAKRTPKRTLWITVGIVAAIAAAWLASRMLASANPSRAERTPLTSGTVIEPPRSLSPFLLRDHEERAFGRERLVGRWSLLFFGFANCGDICPVTLALLASTRQSLQDLPESDRPQIVFVSVDSQRDTPARLKSYVATFGMDIVGVTGEQPSLDAFSTSLGAPGGIRSLDNGGIAVDHSAAIFAIDPSGQWRALFSPPHTVAALAGDYRRLVGMQR